MRTHAAVPCWGTQTSAALAQPPGCGVAQRSPWVAGTCALAGLHEALFWWVAVPISHRLPSALSMQVLVAVPTAGPAQPADVHADQPTVQSPPAALHVQPEHTMRSCSTEPCAHAAAAATRARYATASSATGTQVYPAVQSASAQSMSPSASSSNPSRQSVSVADPPPPAAPVVEVEDEDVVVSPPLPPAPVVVEPVIVVDEVVEVPPVVDDPVSGARPSVERVQAPARAIAEARKAKEG